jgi:hypothetical protein
MSPICRLSNTCSARVVKISTPLNETAVRNALLRILVEGGVKPKDNWITVRLVHGSGPWAGMFIVVLAYPIARTELTRTLRQITGGRAEKETVGVWVLTQLEARKLCAGMLNDAQQEPFRIF